MGRQFAQRLLLIFQLRWVAGIRRRLGQSFDGRLGIIESDHSYRFFKIHVGFGDAADLQQ